jgi:hypothetical protein
MKSLSRVAAPATPGAHWPFHSAFPGGAAFLVDNDGNFASAIPVTPKIPAVSTPQSFSGGMCNAYVTIIFMEFASLC